MRESGTIKLRDKIEVNQRKNSIALLDFAKSKIKIKGKFVDIGCSDGWAIEYIEKNFDTKGVGVSIDERDIIECGKYGISVIKADMQDLTDVIDDNELDFVYCRHTLEHVFNLIDAIKEMFRIIKPGGKVILSVPEYCEKYLHCESHVFVMPPACWFKLFRMLGFWVVNYTCVIGLETEYAFILEKKK